MLDETDLSLLRLLVADGRTTNAELARQVEMAPSAVLERVRRLEERGVIQGYAARLQPRALGLGLLAFVSVRLDGPGDVAAGQKLAKVPEVQEVHHVAGEDCLLVKVRVADAEALGRLLREKFKTLPEVRSTRSTIVLETVKETPALPVPRRPPGGDT